MTRTCDVPGCDTVHRAVGYCAMHYNRWRRYGDPHVNTQTRPPRTRQEAGTCETCHRPMRNREVRMKDAPGTVLRERPGACKTCAKVAKFEPSEAAKYAHNRAGLVAYLQDRRRRGIREDGTMRCLEEAQ